MELRIVEVPPRKVVWSEASLGGWDVLVGVSEEGELCRVSFLEGREVGVILDEWHRDWLGTTFKKGKVAKGFDKLPMVAVGTVLQGDAWREIAQIPYGETATYGEIAERIGLPGRARAVGRACWECRLGWVIPCHRVVAAGGLGGFGLLGTQLKETLLRAEGWKK